MIIRSVSSGKRVDDEHPNLSGGHDGGGCFRQYTTEQVSGIVRDSTWASVGNVTVPARNVATGQVRTAPSMRQDTTSAADRRHIFVFSHIYRYRSGRQPTLVQDARWLATLRCDDAAGRALNLGITRDRTGNGGAAQRPDVIGDWTAGGTPNFGQVTSATDPRTLQFGLRVAFLRNTRKTEPAPRGINQSS
jgi:hypothetical protein